MFGGKEDERPWNERYPYLARPFDHFKDLKPMVAPDPVKEDQAAMAIRPPEEIPGVELRAWTEEEIEAFRAFSNGQTQDRRKKRELEPLLKSLDELSNIKGEGEETENFRKLIKDIKMLSSKVDVTLENLIQAESQWIIGTFLKLMK
jgi:hypothetical protein